MVVGASGDAPTPTCTRVFHRLPTSSTAANRVGASPDAPTTLALRIEASELHKGPPEASAVQWPNAHLPMAAPGSRRPQRWTCGLSPYCKCPSMRARDMHAACDTTQPPISWHYWSMGSRGKDISHRDSIECHPANGTQFPHALKAGTHLCGTNCWLATGPWGQCQNLGGGP
jgi:hypothetical protein